MKKILFLASLMCATIAMAAPTITGTSQIDLSSAGQTDKYVRFIISPSFSDGFDNSYDAQAANENGIYVYGNGNRYTMWASNAYTAFLPLGFYTCENTAYTLKFSNFTGTSYEIYDRVENYTITVNGSTPNYDFTIDESEKNSQINDRFIINYNSASFVASVTTNEDGWASFTDQVAGRDVAPVYSSGLKVYKGKVNGTDPNNIVFDLSQVSAIYWGQGVFVKGAPLTTYHFVLATADMHDFDDNEIIGCAEDKPVEEIRIGGQYEIYALRHEGDSPTALYQYVGTDAIPAGKAVMRIHWDDYLIVSGPAPRRITVRVNETEETQAIENVELAAPAEKFIENGEVLIRRGEVVYNLQGQMVR